MFRNILKNIFLLCAMLYCVSAYATPVPTATSTATPGGFGSVISRINTDGYVYAITSTADSLYIAGKFNNVCTRTGFGIVLDNSGNTVSGFPEIAACKRVLWDYEGVYSVASDGNGGRYIAGSFGEIADISKNDLAHIYSNGVVDTSVGSGSGVSCDESRITETVYDGVYLSKIYYSSEETRTYLQSSAPVQLGPGFDIKPYTIAAGDGFLYVFGSIREIAIYEPLLRRIDLSNGNVDTVFLPEVNGEVYSMVYDNGKLYIGGLFNTVNSVSRNNLARIDAVTGELDLSFNPDVNGKVNTVYNDGVELFISGDFSEVGGIPLTRVAKIDPITGIADDAYNPSPDNVVYAIASDRANNTVYLGGYFHNIGGNAIRYLAKTDITTGAVDTSFNPKPSGVVKALDYNGENLFVGGAFTGINSFERKNVAKLDLAASVVDGAFTADTDGDVSALGFDNLGALYIGGEFSSVGGQVRYRMAKVDTLTGSVDASFFQMPSISYGVFSIAFDGTNVYFGGIFDSPVKGLFRINALTGVVDTGFDLSLNGSVNVLLKDGSNIYMGGNFTTAAGVPAGKIAKYDYVSGSIDGTFVPDIDSTVYSLCMGDGCIFAGGIFNNVSGTSAKYLVKLNSNDGSRIESFSPVIAGANTRAIQRRTGELYIGGDIYGTGTFYYLDMGMIKEENGAPYTNQIFYPDEMIRSLLLSPDNETLYVGGKMTRISNGRSCVGFAALHLGPVPTATSTMTVTFTKTCTYTITPTFTETEFISPTITVTASQTLTYTITPTITVTSTFTVAPTLTATVIISEPGIFPNPSSGIVRIYAGDIAGIKEVEISIYSLAFRLVKKAAYNTENGNIFLMDMQNMANGSYAVCLEYYDDKGKKVRRHVKVLVLIKK